MARIKTIFDDIDEDAEARAIAEAEADVATGRVVPHDEVVKWLSYDRRVRKSTFGDR
jgi:predicted transcriptional regulator